MTASTNGASGRSPEMGKFWGARSVWIPYGASSGTANSPSESRSMRVAFIRSVRSVTAASVSNQESPMDAPDLVQRPSERARFAAAKMTKIDCFRSDRLLLGLNCFAPGQDQPAHSHADADKFYFVVSGKASFVLGGCPLAP